MRQPFPPRLIYRAAAVVIGLGIVSLAAWAATGNFSWVTVFFRYPGAAFLTFSGLLELGFAWSAWRQFSRDEPMFHAWAILVLAASCRLAGTLCSEVLAPNFADPSTFASIRQVGLVTGGPLHMFLLAAALWCVLLVYRSLGILARLTWSDYSLLTLVVLYLCRHLYEVSLVLRGIGKPVTALEAANWLSDPLLTALAILAITLRRSALEMGGGLVAQCWSAYTAGALFTSLGDAAMWASNYSILPWPYSSVTWFIWLFAASAYAAAPGYQVAAVRIIHDGLARAGTMTPGSLPGARSAGH